MMESAQSGAGHLRGDFRPAAHAAAGSLIGTGPDHHVRSALGIAVGVWPRTLAQQSSRRRSVRAPRRANAVVHDVRERVTGQGSEMRAA